MAQNTTYVWLVVHYNGTNTTSTKKRVFGLNETMITYFEAQIALNKGIPESITWANQKDFNQTLIDTCDECDKNKCIDGFCGEPISKFNCTSSPRGCDVRCYLAFVGEDKDKRKCKKQFLIFFFSPFSFFFFYSKRCFSSKLAKCLQSLFMGSSLPHSFFNF